MAGPVLRRLRSDRGFSVVELVIALGLFILILGAVLTMLDASTRHERDQQARQDTLQDLRTAMNRMTKDVRQATSIDPASTRDRLVMETIVAGAPRQMVYEVNVNSELLRTIDGQPPGTPLATGLTSTQLFCFDPPGCTLSNPVGTTLTRIRVALVAAPEVGTGNPISLATDVELRNL